MSRTTGLVSIASPGPENSTRRPQHSAGAGALALKDIFAAIWAVPKIVGRPIVDRWRKPLPPTVPWHSPSATANLSMATAEPPPRRHEGRPLLHTRRKDTVHPPT